MAHILRHKSWHVYSKDNMERVRKDELDAAIESERAEEQTLQRERERRYEGLLQSKAEEGAGAMSGRVDRASAGIEGGISEQPRVPTKSEKEKREWDKLEAQFSVGLSSTHSKAVPWYLRPKTAEGGDTGKGQPSCTEMEDPAEKFLKRRKVAEPAARGAVDLKAERREREKKERARTLRLLNKSGFNSQYHPDIARKR